MLQFRIPGARTPQYAALRALRSEASVQPVFRVDEQGAIARVATLSLLMGGMTLVQFETLDAPGSQPAQPALRLYDGLPPAMMFAAPSGFLGRQLGGSVSGQLGLPASVKDWSIDHVAQYLFAFASDTPGDLVFGSGALDRLLAQRAIPPVAALSKLEHYRACATQSIAQPIGSSAGGEQPKFTAEVEDIGHVIVKFARAGTRMADLLVLEELALSALARSGISAAQSEVVHHAGFVFLESRRFDRVGRFGRLGVLSAGAIDDEHFGHRDSWSAFAQRCATAGLLTKEQAQVVDTLAVFSELIGNGDTHFENLSLTVGAKGVVSGVAPAYDMSPMRYAALGAELEPELTPLAPSIRNGGTTRLDVWQRAVEAASDFWGRARTEQALSAGMRDLAGANLAVVGTFALPLLGQKEQASAKPTPPPQHRRMRTP